MLGDPPRGSTSDQLPPASGNDDQAAILEQVTAQVMTVLTVLFAVLAFFQLLAAYAGWTAFVHAAYPGHRNPLLLYPLLPSFTRPMPPDELGDVGLFQHRLVQEAVVEPGQRTAHVELDEAKAVLEHLSSHLAGKPSRSDGVDPHSPVCLTEGEVPRHVDHGSLARLIRGREIARAAQPKN